MNDNDDVFLQQMKGVNPIQKKNRVEKEKLKTNIKNIKNKKKNKDLNKTVDDCLNKNKPEFSLQNVNIKKNIRKGSFKIDKKIDFHGKTLLSSEEQFTDTIVNCYNDGLRCLLFVTGKGLYKSEFFNKTGQPKLYHGVIRSALIRWVKSKKFSKYILSYEAASIEHGGDGAFYVYLRKKKN